MTGARAFIGSPLTEQMIGEGAQPRTFVGYNSQLDFGLIALLPRNQQGRT